MEQQRAGEPGNTSRLDEGEEAPTALFVAFEVDLPERILFGQEFA